MFVVLMSLASLFVLATTTSLSPQKNISRTSAVSFANSTINVKWAANDTAITFTINASIDEGWLILLGWMKGPGNASSRPKKLGQTRADVLVFFQNKVLDCNTLRKKGGLQKDKDKNDLVFSKQKDGKRHVTVWKVTRRLDTEHKYEDVAIKPGPMLLFAAQAKNKLEHLKDMNLKDVDSSIEFAPVHFVVEHPTGITPTTNGNNTSHFREFIGHIIREHWIAVLVGSASVATLFITLLVYCCCRRKKDSKKKKVKVSFFKEEEDFDQEARVSLISATT